MTEKSYFFKWLLFILTSEMVLHMLFASQNNRFSAF